MNESDLLSPSEVLEQVAKALPIDVRDNLIVCGSLAAAYWFFAGDGSRAIRTKDIDGLCSPHATAQRPRRLPIEPASGYAGSSQAS